jgi:large subunit ribosomal protein L1
MGKTKTAFVGEELESKNKQKHEKAHKNDVEKVHVSGLKGGQRVKVVEAAETEEAPIFEEGSEAVSSETGEKKTKKIVEKIRSKKYQEAKAKIEPGKSYPLKEAIKLVKETSYSSFDGTVELHLMVKKTGTSAQLTLPHAAGREKKVEIASDETVLKLKEGKIDFDILVSTPEMMPKLVPFAKILGPKGLMPNPKNGTLVPDPKKAKGFSAGTVMIKTEKEAPLIHTVIGKVSQDDKELIENLEAIVKALGGTKQIVRAFIKSTMSPSVKLLIG